VLYLITPRAARNMAFQGLLRLADKVDGCVGEVKGSELIGCKVHAPNAVLNEVYVLPMDSVSATKVSG
jgi:leucyl-tRNA synthetase